MRTHDYRCVYKSDEVAQYVCQAKIFGEIDFILAHRNISYKMLERAQDKEIFSRTVKVLRPEDIIGLKIQALANDETRVSKEYSDIESLLGLYKKDLDWALLEEYFRLFDLGHKYQNTKINTMLSEQDKKELLEMAHSERIREDFRIMAGNRHNPF